MSTLLDLISGSGETPQAGMDKVASSAGEDVYKEKMAEMYKVGCHMAEQDLTKAAEEATGSSCEKSQKKDETEEEYKSRRKSELMKDMESNPSKKEEYKKEAGLL